MGGSINPKQLQRSTVKHLVRFKCNRLRSSRSGGASSSLRISAGLGFEVSQDLVVTRNTHLIAEERGSNVGGFCYMHLWAV